MAKSKKIQHKTVEDIQRSIAEYRPLDILDQASAIVASRGKSYGARRKGMEKIAELWKPIIGVDITPEQVALCMIQVKIARELYSHKQDNLIDIAGYAFVLGEVVDNR